MKPSNLIACNCNYGSNPTVCQSQEMTACIRGNAQRCQVDYSISGLDATTPDTFEVGAAIANSETEDCAIAALHINQCNVATQQGTTAAVGLTCPTLTYYYK